MGLYIWRTVSALVLALSVAACGGGDGGESAGDPAATPTEFSGIVYRLSSQGEVVPAGAGQTVQLVALGADGAAASTLGTASTDGSGRYRLTAPDGMTGGMSAALVTDDGAGGTWRALALHESADLGPASEAVTQELLAARIAYGAGFSEGVARLRRFGHNATVMLALTPPERSEPAAAVARLREWLTFDPAAVRALNTLSTSGRLPATLGDIGGLMGYVQGAWEIDDDVNGASVLTALPTDSSGLQWSVQEFAPGRSYAQESAEYVFEADGVREVAHAVQDSASQVLLDLIGAHKVASFDLEPGKTQSLASVEVITRGYSFDGDAEADTLKYQVTQTVVGAGQVVAFGVNVRGWRVNYRTVLTLELTMGGAITLIEDRARWTVPFAGVVREDVKVRVTAPDGTEVTEPSLRVVGAAVANDVSWPGGLRVRTQLVATPRPVFQAQSLGLSTDLALTWFGGVDTAECCHLDFQLSSRTVGDAYAAEDVTVPQGSLGSRVFVSPDGSKVYLVHNQHLPERTGSPNVDTDYETAAAAGAVIVRYDARSLREEVRVKLPPIASRTLPGRYFARNHLRSLLASPADPTAFVASGVDAILVRGESMAPRVLDQPSDERLLFDGTAELLDALVGLRGWDADRDELWADLSDGLQQGAVVPIRSDGLHGEEARAGIPRLSMLDSSLSGDATFDHVGPERAYLNGYTTVVDSRTGSVVARLGDAHPELLGARCTLRKPKVLCATGDAVYQLDAGDLRLEHTWMLQPGLRDAVGATHAGGPLDRLFAPLEGELVFLTGNRDYSLEGDPTMMISRLYF